jgi:hypothetical protein
MDELKALGYEITLSEVCPIPRFGKYWIHAYRADKACVYGHGDDEAAAIADALVTLSRFK